MQLRLSDLPFASAAISQRIGEYQVFVKRGIPKHRLRSASIQRRKRYAALFPLFVRPDGNGILTLRNHAQKWLSRIRRHHTARDGSSFCRERILETVHEELFERRKIRPFLQPLP